ncbi:MAG: hypothetical protein IPJ18_21140 [Betaproteobacteria bacterium]|nr:hypothetical protein [Betaproteobacteria bacterium]
MGGGGLRSLSLMTGSTFLIVKVLIACIRLRRTCAVYDSNASISHSNLIEILPQHAKLAPEVVMCPLLMAGTDALQHR